MNKNITFILSLILIMFIVVFSVGEILSRVLLGEKLRTYISERNVAFQHHPEFGWTGQADIHISLTASREMIIKHNSKGFLDKEFTPSGKPVLLFLGDSFIWGYDSNIGERFIDLIQPEIADWQTVNLGVSGYGMDQAMMLLKHEVDYYKPKVVFWLISKNDREDNSTNVRYGGFYKPYTLIENDQLSWHGMPVPQGLSYHYNSNPTLSYSYLYRTLSALWLQKRNPILENPDPTYAILNETKQFLDEKEILLLIGFNYLDEPLKNYCQEIGLSYVNLQNPHYYKTFGSHWTAEGHLFAKEHLLQFFEAGDFLAMDSE